jgi:hypothetical protein
VCRLYPLRRITLEDGSEDFDLLDFEERCTAVAGNRGTVGGYLKDQKAGPYLDMADRYVKLMDMLTAALSQEIDGDNSLTRHAMKECVSPGVKDSGSLPPWLDVDPVVSAYCARTGLPIPNEADKRAEMHITVLEEWLAGHEGVITNLSTGRGRCDGTGKLTNEVARIKSLAHTVALLGYMIGVDVEELGLEKFGIVN